MSATDAAVVAAGFPGAPELDRASFEVAYEVAAVRVPAKRTGQFLKELKNQLLNIPRRKNVESSGDGANLILLSCDLQGDVSKLPDVERAWLEKQLGAEVSTTRTTVRVGYENLNAEEVLAKLLPPGIEVPSSFEQAGHLCHLNLRDSQLPYRFIIGQVILDKNKSLRTVVNKTGKIETEFRTFPMEHLAGDKDTVVQLKEQGCIFEFEFQDVYWNSRLQMEHGRLIQALFLAPVVDDRGLRPTIADATCGVGPFSIPIIKCGSSIVSHANDLNPASVKWLRRNAEVNRLPDVVEVQSLPPYTEEFAQLSTGDSKLVIHAPGDARVFIRKLHGQRHPVTHSIFNLPATGIELLDCYKGLDFCAQGLPRPLVCCYTFSDGPLDDEGPAGCVADLLGRLAKVLDLPVETLKYARSCDEATSVADANGARLPLASPQVAVMVREASMEPARAEVGRTRVAVRLVRNVAPTRHMFCVCFRAPRLSCPDLQAEPVNKLQPREFALG